MTPDFLFATLAQVTPADAMVVQESQSNTAILKKHVLAKQPESFFNTAMGGLGFGLPAAVGIALAQQTTGENRPVIAIIGDGAFQYSIQALYTLAQYQLPLTVIVPFNQEYAVLKAFAEVEQAPGVPGLDLPGLDIVAQAQSFGVEARRITNPQELQPALQEALTRTKPLVIEVSLTKDVPPLF